MPRSLPFLSFLSVTSYAVVAVAGGLLFTACTAQARDANDYFAIEVIDAATGRGVPLVELKTTNDVRYYTDSNGLVAFDEPGLVGGKVFFEVSSPGYETPVDGFGSKGVALVAEPGKSAQLKLKRINVAERLYRITGQGIYADTVRLGRAAPTSRPVLNGRVMGQDSVQALPYRGKIYWFWGDTSRPDYPLGNFGTSGATSPMPGTGKDALDPSRGIDLTYFTDPKSAFSRPMVPLGKPGLVWIDGLTVLKDAAGRERMLASFARLKSLGDVSERGLIAFDDATQTFVPVPRGGIDLKANLWPRGHSLHVKFKGEEYVYFACPFPLIRVKADWDRATNLDAYEAFTCLKQGARYEKGKPARLDRDRSGKLLYAWKRGTDPIGPGEQEELIKSGQLKREEAWLQLRDIATKEPVLAHAGSVAWNAFRKRWVMIFTQSFAKASLLGEVWYAEADAPEGPWRFARKVATHPNYSFYNPCHHPFFDQTGGRLIYFEGTYTADFSGAAVKTPRYNYNQLMYRLDLADPRLKLP
jgi:hypothetical protein